MKKYNFVILEMVCLVCLSMALFFFDSSDTDVYIELLLIGMLLR